MEAVGQIMAFLFSATGQIFALLISNVYIGSIVLFPVIAFIFISIIDTLRGSRDRDD